MYIFVDALDECGQGMAVELSEILRQLVSTAPETNTHFAMCLAYRHYPIINVPGAQEILVEDNNDLDLRQYVDSHFEQLNNQQEPIKEIILEKASGVFQWACLVVWVTTNYARRGRTVNEIESAITEIPGDLQKLYESLLESIKEEDIQESLKLFQ